MNKLTCFVIMALIAVQLIAGSLDKVVLQATNVPLTTTKRTDISSRVSGYINRIDVKFANATSTVDLTIYSSNAISEQTTPLLTRFTSTNLTVQLTNYVQRLMLLDERIYLDCTNSAFSNQNVIGIIFFERP